MTDSNQDKAEEQIAVPAEPMVTPSTGAPDAASLAPLPRRVGRKAQTPKKIMGWHKSNCVAAPGESLPESDSEKVGEELRQIDRRVTDAIGEAKRAASLIDSMRSAGPDEEESLHQRLARRTGTGLTSFGLVLEGIDTAADVNKVQAVLEQFPSIHASVVVNPGRAWITAPDDTNPEDVIQALAGKGIDAYLTRSSLRRRATRLETQPRRRPAVPAAAQQVAEERYRRREAVSRRTSGAEVLFTARELVTRLRFFVSLLLSIPVLVLSLNVEWQFSGWQYWAAGLTTIVALWGGWPFHRAMVASLRRRMSALDGAASMAILLAWGWSIGEIIFGGAGELGFTTAPTLFAYKYDRMAEAELFFDVACGLTVLLLAGRLATRYNRVRTGAVLRNLRISPDRYVTVVRKSTKSAEPEKLRVKIADLNIGDDVVVPPGHSIPVDGVVIGGASKLDSRAMGDVSGDREVKVNSKVWAGTLNKENTLKVRVLRTGSKTRAAAIVKWVVRAIREEDAAYQTAVRSASALIPWTILLAVTAFGAWWLISGKAAGAFSVTLAVLAGVAPMSLAMSTSGAQRLGILSGAQRGILIRGAETFRALSDANVVLFNRVGTLTDGEMHVLSAQAREGENPDLVLRVAGSLVMESEHPVSKAIIRACRASRDAGTGGTSVPHWIETNHCEVLQDGTFTGQVEIPITNKKGVTELRFVEACLWRPRDMSALDERMAVAALGGGSPLVVSWRGQARGVITVGEDIKDDAVEAIDEIEALGVDTMMITRDPYPVARRFADRLGISRVSAGIIGPRKPGVVRSVRAAGENVVMVGDQDILDCLDAADVGVLMNPKTSHAGLDLDEVGVVTLQGRVNAVPEALRLARTVTYIMQTNIAIAWAYNIIILLAALAGLLHPLAAAALMVASSFFIEWRARHLAGNAYRNWRFDSKLGRWSSQASANPLRWGRDFRQHHQ